MKRKHLEGEGELFEISTTRPAPSPPQPKSPLPPNRTLHCLKPDFKTLAEKDPDLKPW